MYLSPSKTQSEYNISSAGEQGVWLIQYLNIGFKRATNSYSQITKNHTLYIYLTFQILAVHPKVIQDLKTTSSIHILNPQSFRKIP